MISRRFGAFVLTLATTCALAFPALSEGRLALVVGNGSYRNVTPLDNPVGDAKLMAQSLEVEGFSVTLLTDATQSELTQSVAKFGRDLRQAGPETTGLFYYAGHGVQSFGTNYLLPVDAGLVDAADLDLVGVQADAILRQMASARNRTNIVILDACRNNPFDSIPTLNDNGLAEMKAPRGTFLAYSTGPGSVAVDGDGANSPFTAALATAIQTPGLSIEEAFKKVRVEVLSQTRGLQVPWDTSSLTEDFVFSAAPSLTADEIAEQQLWNSVERSRDPVQIMLFLRSYPGGRHEAAARALLQEAMIAELAAPVADPAPVPLSPASEPPSVSGPKPDEETAFERARTSRLAADYQAYLDAYPSGTFAEIAALELKSLESATTTRATTPPPAAALPPTPTAAVPDVAVAFDQPLTFGGPDIAGHTLEKLITGSPLFPPIEGLPEEVWKGKHCTNCHEWTREALCTQGGTYLTASGTRSLEKRHPYGGGFKLAIRNWAEAGCK